MGLPRLRPPTAKHHPIKNYRSDLAGSSADPAAAYLPAAIQEGFLVLAPRFGSPDPRESDSQTLASQLLPGPAEELNHGAVYLDFAGYGIFNEHRQRHGVHNILSEPRPTADLPLYQFALVNVDEAKPLSPAPEISSRPPATCPDICRCCDIRTHPRNRNPRRCDCAASNRLQTAPSPVGCSPRCLRPRLQQRLAAGVEPADQPTQWFNLRADTSCPAAGARSQVR